jgi:hypothetical protein
MRGIRGDEGMTGWLDLFRSLGHALVEVLKAELDALEEDVTRSGRQLGLGLGLLGGAGALVFWILGVVLFAVVALLSRWLPVWGAALAVAGLFALIAALLVRAGLAHLRRFENPLRTAKRRLEDHVDWVQSRLLVEEKVVGAGFDSADPLPHATRKEPK